MKTFQRFLELLIKFHEIPEHWVHAALSTLQRKLNLSLYIFFGAIFFALGICAISMAIQVPNVGSPTTGQFLLALNQSTLYLMGVFLFIIGYFETKLGIDIDQERYGWIRYFHEREKLRRDYNRGKWSIACNFSLSLLVLCLDQLLTVSNGFFAASTSIFVLFMLFFYSFYAPHLNKRDRDKRKEPASKGVPSET